MSLAHIRSVLTLVLALGTLSARVVDQTTGQPMPGLRVAIEPGATHARTDAHGRVTHHLPAGAYTVRLESHDVPPQTFRVRIQARHTTHATLKVCSMTLDYHCSIVPSGGGG